MDSNEGPPPVSNFIDLTSPESEPPIFPSQTTEVTSPAQSFNSLGQTQLVTPKIEMSSDKPSLFRPPAFTLDLFNEYVDEDDTAIEEKPEGTSTPQYSTIVVQD